MMTDTKVTSKILGTAWPGHFNKPLAQAMYKNIQKVGMPKWTDDDEQLAIAVQKLLEAPEKDMIGNPIKGMNKRIDTIEGSVPFSWEGCSDDIADISWNLPTIVLRYPANIKGTKGHHWGDAIAMATPIAHKGVTAGAKVEAMTIIDFLLKPSLIEDAWDYFNNVQSKETKYKPMIDARAVLSASNMLISK